MLWQNNFALKFYPDPDGIGTYDDWGPNRTATATYKADSNEVNTNSKVNILDNKAENVQSIKMAMQNVLVDSFGVQFWWTVLVDSFGGQVFFGSHT